MRILLTALLVLISFKTLKAQEENHYKRFRGGIEIQQEWRNLQPQTAVGINSRPVFSGRIFAGYDFTDKSFLGVGIGLGLSNRNYLQTPYLEYQGMFSTKPNSWFFQGQVVTNLAFKNNFYLNGDVVENYFQLSAGLGKRIPLNKSFLMPVVLAGYTQADSYVPQNFYLGNGWHIAMAIKLMMKT